MKWFFSLSEASLSDDNLYADCIRAAVISAKRNTRLAPHFLYDGVENDFLQEIRALGVRVIHHRSVLYDRIMNDKPHDQHFIRVASGAFLRIDIPIVENDDEFVLYTDCDVLFQKNPELTNIRPAYFAVAPEFTIGDYDNMNSGVMLINVPNMRAVHEDLVKYIRGYRISDFASYDQVALRNYFVGMYEKLPEILNWKPYWGRNEAAEIVHFHGPKPPHVRALLGGAGDAFPAVLKDLYQRDPSYYQEVVDVWHAALAEAFSHAHVVTEASKMIQGKFEHRAPSAQNAVDIFAGKWATNLQPVCGVTSNGPADLLTDPRIQMAADQLGKDGRFDGARILELGPLEGAHTYQLEQLGAAHVVAVESNTEAYLKCLVLKEILQMKSSFLCGDVVAYLNETSDHYDIIFCSGILYHMADPVRLISFMCQRAASCFIWTHFQSEDAVRQDIRKPRRVVSAGFETTYYEYPYPDMSDGRFWGGNRPVAAWMTQDEIIRAFCHFGFASSMIWQDLGNPNGSAFSLAAWR